MTTLRDPSMFRGKEEEEELAMKTEKLVASDFKIKPRECCVLKVKWRICLKKETRHL